MLELIRDFRLLSRASRLDMETYLNSFYEQLQTMKASASDDLYLKLREVSPEAIPAGADPEIYQLRR